MVYIYGQIRLIAMENGMSKSEEIMVKNLETKVVKLRIDGSKATVNTIENSAGEGRISLVCPFPALEVDIPVSLGENRQGTLQRIGVEEDHETGLPRLKLLISAEGIPSSPDVQDPHEECEEVEQGDIISSEFCDEAYVGLGDAQSFQDSEPAWIDCSNLPSPDEFSEQMRSRKRYKVAKRAAWLTVLAILVCGGYVAERIGIVDVNTIRSQIAGFSIDDIVLGKQEADTSRQEEVQVAAKNHTENLIPTPVENIKPIEDSAPEIAAPEIATPQEQPQEKALESNPEATNPVIVTTSLEQEGETAEPESDAPVQAVKQQSGQPVSATPNATEATVLLPTRWPVEYATAYRVRDPAGVVVDVPGGLVKREGMLNYRNQTSLIRSAKSIQRETGARFIIFVRGDKLPRFITTPQSNGVSLRLYYNKDGAAASDQIASLE